MNIQSESRYAWSDVDTEGSRSSHGRYEYSEVEVGYLAAQLLVRSELLGYQAGTSWFWQRWARSLRRWLSREGRMLCTGGRAVARLRALG
jgi:hypothetical protein